jgi:hypothetical protein
MKEYRLYIDFFVVYNNVYVNIYRSYMGLPYSTISRARATDPKAPHNPSISYLETDLTTIPNSTNLQNITSNATNLSILKLKDELKLNKASATRW